MGNFKILNKNGVISHNVLCLCLCASVMAFALFLTGCPEESSGGQYTCANGDAADGAPDSDDNVERCVDCDAGFALNTTTMLCENAFACPNGTPDDGIADTAGEIRCASCMGGYTLENNSCRQAKFTCMDGSEAGDIPDSSDPGDVE